MPRATTATAPDEETKARGSFEIVTATLRKPAVASAFTVVSVRPGLRLPGPSARSPPPSDVVSVSGRGRA